VSEDIPSADHRVTEQPSSTQERVSSCILPILVHGAMTSDHGNMVQIGSVMLSKKHWYRSIKACNVFMSSIKCSPVAVILVSLLDIKHDYLYAFKVFILFFASQY